MKTVSKLTLALMILLTTSACDQLDELTEFDFNTTLNESFFLALQGGIDQPFNQTTTFNIVNEDTQDYIDALQDVEITSFTYRFVNFSGDAAGTIDGSLQADNMTLFVHNNLNVKQAADEGTVFPVTDVSALNSIATSLKNGNDVSVGLSGSYSSEGTMSFTIEMTIGLAITADVL
ncbi:MAG: hypothetical protein HKP45_09440 [Winogradskyella sp.]|nr:hypothetical protein [Winogradskyella sp.]